MVAGHSLGAHVAGFAGKRVRQLTGSLVHAVVALYEMSFSFTKQKLIFISIYPYSDPAGPLFSSDDPTNRFDHTDATYVESIVTDGGRLGFEHPVAHANFYPSELFQNISSIISYIELNIFITLDSQIGEQHNPDVHRMILPDNVAIVSLALFSVHHSIQATYLTRRDAEI